MKKFGGILWKAGEYKGKFYVKALTGDTAQNFLEAEKFVDDVMHDWKIDQHPTMLYEPIKARLMSKRVPPGEVKRRARKQQYRAWNKRQIEYYCRYIIWRDGQSLPKPSKSSQRKPLFN